MAAMYPGIGGEHASRRAIRPAYEGIETYSLLRDDATCAARSRDPPRL